MQIDINGQAMNVSVLFSETAIRDRIKELAQQINQDYGKEETLIILIVLHGALIFGADLVRNLEMPTEIETVRLKSYEGMQSSGKIQLVGQLPKSLENNHVLIIEDIIDTGRSIHFLLNELKNFNPKSVKVCSLLNKPEAQEFSIKADYSGFDIQKHFVIGYGLDLDGKYRNLPYIANLSKSS